MENDPGLNGKKRLLVAYAANSTFVKTTYDYLSAFAKYSSYEVYYLNVVNVAQVSVNLDAFDVVILNYCARIIFDDYVSGQFLNALAGWRGTKILSVQDEYDFTNKLKEKIREIDFNVVLTCVPEDMRQLVYPDHQFPNVRFHQVLTGYAPETTPEFVHSVRPLHERPIQIGYRGRDIGPRYGRLGRAKFEIGTKMKEVCIERGITHDIEVDEDKRLYGDQWFEFIGNCRAMLGTESGSNVFDFDGSLATAFAKRNYGAFSSLELPRDLSAMIESQDCSSSMGQISPRIFECAMLKTALILYPGRYSNILRAGEHYIELKEDFSNIDTVLTSFLDLESMAAMVERTWRDLIASGQYSYKSFISEIENLISERAKAEARNEIRHEDVLLGKEPILEITERGEFVETPTREILSQDALKSRIRCNEAALYIREAERVWADLYSFLTVRHRQAVPRFAMSSRKVDSLKATVATEVEKLWPNIGEPFCSLPEFQQFWSQFSLDRQDWFDGWRTSQISGYSALAVTNESDLESMSIISLEMHKARYDIFCSYNRTLRELALQWDNRQIRSLIKRFLKQVLVRCFGVSFADWVVANLRLLGKRVQ